MLISVTDQFGNIGRVVPRESFLDNIKSPSPDKTIGMSQTLHKILIVNFPVFVDKKLSDLGNWPL